MGEATEVFNISGINTTLERSILPVLTSPDMVCFIRIEDIPVQGWYLDVRISPWGIAAFPFDPAVEHIQVFLLKSPDWESL